MIHLSRFLIGIRHARVFRIRSLAGEVIDDLVRGCPKDYTKVGGFSAADEVLLSNDDSSLITKITRDDILVEGKKLFDWESKNYVEVNRLKILDLAKSCLSIISKRFELEKDYFRVGIIFEFRIPARGEDVEQDFGKFIFENFINFETKGEKSEGNLRFIYKMKVPEGGVINKVKDFRNTIITLNPSKGIGEDGKEKNCLFVSADIQRIFDPMIKEVDIDEHYVFSENHLKTVIFPDFSKKGVEITL